MGEFTAYSTGTYTADGYSRPPTEMEFETVSAYAEKALQMPPLEFWRPGSLAAPQEAALQSISGSEVESVALLPSVVLDTLKEHFFTAGRYETGQRFIDLVERYHVTARFGKQSYGAERLLQKLGELTGSVPADARNLTSIDEEQQRRIDSLALAGYANSGVMPEASVKAAREISSLTGSPRPESIGLLQRVLMKLEVNDWLSLETKRSIREQAYMLLGLYSMGYVEALPASEKWKDARGEWSTLLYQYNSAELSAVAKEALSFSELLAS